MRIKNEDVPTFPCFESEDGKCFNFLCLYRQCRYYSNSNDRSCLEAPQYCPSFQNCSTCLNIDCPANLPF